MDNEVELILLGDSIPVAAFLDAAENLRRILAELAKDLTDVKLSWSISNLRMGSAALAQSTPIETPDEAEATREVVDSMMSGLALITEKPERPRNFSDRILEQSRRLSKAIEGPVTGVVVRGRFGSDQREIKVTKQLEVNVEKIVGKPYHYRGSVEGVLEVVSIHGGFSVAIVDSLRQRLITCICDEETFTKLRELLGKRMRLKGHIRTDKRGRPSEIKVETYQILRSREELPQAADVRGIVSDLDVIPAEEIRELARSVER